ncbi:MAG: metal-dependent hydrolase [Thermoplasmatota archaeon]
MKITWHGHAFFELETANGKHVLIDPFVKNGVTRKTVRDFDPDLVLVTHAHGDHVGSATEFAAPLVTNYELASELAKRGAHATVGMNIGGFVARDGLRIYMANALHSSGFHPEGSPAVPGGNPCGFVVDDGETKFYHAGDTGLFGDMKTVLRDVLKPDVAAIPIGDLYTMGPEHAAIAAEWCGVATALPMHYDTFDAIRVDPARWAKDAEGRGVRALVPKVDASIEVRGRRLVRAT